MHLKYLEWILCVLTANSDIAIENYPFLLVYIIKMVDCPSLKIVCHLSDWKLRSEFVREWLRRSNSSIVFLVHFVIGVLFPEPVQGRHWPCFVVSNNSIEKGERWLRREDTQGKHCLKLACENGNGRTYECINIICIYIYSHSGKLTLT